MKIAIIGTAGRGSDAGKLRPDSFDRMCAFAENFLQGELKVPVADRHLVSGGAAYADHIAVSLFLNGRAETLSIHLPAAFDPARREFVDSGVVDSRENPGGTANYYHRRFSKACGVQSLNDLHSVISKSFTKVTVSNGLEARNRLVASEVDAVLSFTFGHGRELKPGGTARTMDTFLKRQRAAGKQPIAYHVDLNTWEFHPAMVAGLSA